MAWKIEIDKKALKELAALDKPIQKRIASFLKDKLAKMQNPRSIGEALQGELKKFWKYRIGDYRLICSIEDKIVTVLVLRVDHRREVYKVQVKSLKDLHGTVKVKVSDDANEPAFIEYY